MTEAMITHSLFQYAAGYTCKPLCPCSFELPCFCSVATLRVSKDTNTYTQPHCHDVERRGSMVLNKRWRCGKKQRAAKERWRWISSWTVSLVWVHAGHSRKHKYMTARWTKITAERWHWDLCDLLLKNWKDIIYKVVRECPSLWLLSVTFWCGSTLPCFLPFSNLRWTKAPNFLHFRKQRGNEVGGGGYTLLGS